jgi:Heat induced stress protein YflT domain
VETANQVDSTPRRAIASFERYMDAEEFVDRLADRGFPVEHVVIVGRDPAIVERVTGRLDAWRALLSGALSGALIGLLFGWLFALFFAHDGTSVLAILGYWLVTGIVVGALFGLISYAFSGQRSFTSTSTIKAARYEVLVDDAHADAALRVATDPSTPRPGGAAG